LREGDALDAAETVARAHETQPPARFTEASLVRELEERGIGRPSTYASIIQTIQDRGYVHKRGSALVPNLIAFAVTRLLEEHFPELVDLDFTARMEDRLDMVAAGEIDSRPWLRGFYFGGDEDATVNEDPQNIGLKGRIAEGWQDIDARAVSSIPLGTDPQGREVAARVGRYGPYVQVEDTAERASLPEDLPPDEVTLERALELLAEAAQGDQVLGHDPESARPIYLKTGRYGPYFQLGEDEDDGGKPKRGSLWPGMSMESVTLEDALKVLSFPKTLGTHPETGTPVTAQDGPNGPYLKMGTESRSLRDHDHLDSITLEEALQLFAQPKQPRGRSAPVALKELGEHPTSHQPLRILRGRFGPYVTDGVVNASLPGNRDPQLVELDEALELLAAREERLREQGVDPRAPKPTRRRSAATRSRANGARPTSNGRSRRRSA
jgi:DNA topoisomerase-1